MSISSKYFAHKMCHSIAATGVAEGERHSPATYRMIHGAETDTPQYSINHALAP